MTGHESTRAREARPEKTYRVQYIAGLMSANQWVTGKSGPPLAKEWGVSVRTVEADAIEASRLVRLTQAPQVRMRLAIMSEKALARIEEVLEENAKGGGKCPVCGRSDVDAPKALPAIVKSYSELVGADAPKRHEIDVKAAPEWKAIQGVLFVALEPYPDAFDAVMRALGVRMAPALTEGSDDGG